MGVNSMNDAGRIGFLIKGNYNHTTTYDFLDVVYFGHSSYVAKKLTIGNEPAETSEYWQVLASTPSNAVTGVKGSEETAFRTGDVNLTPANIGALPSNGTAVSAQKLTKNAGTENIPIYFKDGVPSICQGSVARKKILFSGEITVSPSYTDGIYGVSNAEEYDLIDVLVDDSHIYFNFRNNLSFYPSWVTSGLSEISIITMNAYINVSKSGTGYVEFSLPIEHIISSNDISANGTEVTIHSAIGYIFH